MAVRLLGGVMHFLYNWTDEWILKILSIQE